jgi:nitronate monooxygenase
MKLETLFIQQAGVCYPIICGAMYPCSNLELVAAASKAGALGVVQPLSLMYVYGYDLREGLRQLKKLAERPFGMNIILERSSKLYEKRMRQAVEIALEESCRFFITSLGNPKWVVEMVKPCNGFVYHDATERKWAEKALTAGVDGIICVNNRAGGHAGVHSAEKLYQEMTGLGVPLVCAGGIGNETDFIEALKIGYAAVQMGTRFIATCESLAAPEYKQAIVDANESDIILTERVTGIPLSVIRTPYVEKIGTKISPLARLLFRNRLTKKLIRSWYGLRAVRKFKKSALQSKGTKDYWQAGKSVSHIYAIEPVDAIIQRFVQAAKKA